MFLDKNYFILVIYSYSMYAEKGKLVLTKNREKYHCSIG